MAAADLLASRPRAFHRDLRPPGLISHTPGTILLPCFGASSSPPGSRHRCPLGSRPCLPPGSRPRPFFSSAVHRRALLFNRCVVHRRAPRLFSSGALLLSPLFHQRRPPCSSALTSQQRPLGNHNLPTVAPLFSRLDAPLFISSSPPPWLTPCSSASMLLLPIFSRQSDLDQLWISNR